MVIPRLGISARKRVEPLGRPRYPDVGPVPELAPELFMCARGRVLQCPLLPDMNPMQFSNVLFPLLAVLGLPGHCRDDQLEGLGTVG